MQGEDFLLKDTHGLELEIERHCVGLKLDCSDEYQVHQFVGEMMQNMEQLKDAAGRGDRSARAKVELFGMAVLMHKANVKAFGPGYLANIDVLAKQESAWVAIAKAMWSELEGRNLDNE